MIKFKIPTQCVVRRDPTGGAKNKGVEKEKADLLSIRRKLGREGGSEGGVWGLFRTV